MEVEEQEGEKLGDIGYPTRSSPGHICIRSVMTTRYQDDWKFVVFGRVVSVTVSALITSVHNANS
jgi:hypothetical protein